jgi:hypothetical protein
MLPLVGSSIANLDQGTALEPQCTRHKTRDSQVVGPGVPPLFAQQRSKVLMNFNLNHKRFIP